MPKRVLDVGQCGPDHAAIRRFFAANFDDVEIEQAAACDDALALLRHSHFDLVLINRKLDEDYSDGIEVLRAIKRHPEIADVPGDDHHQLPGTPRCGDRRRRSPRLRQTRIRPTGDQRKNRRRPWHVGGVSDADFGRLYSATTSFTSCTKWGDFPPAVSSAAIFSAFLRSGYSNSATRLSV